MGMTDRPLREAADEQVREAVQGEQGAREALADRLTARWRAAGLGADAAEPGFEPGAEAGDEVMGGPVRFPGGIAMPVQIERVLGFGRSFSFWPLLFGLACCAIEMMALGGSRFDMSRFGMEAMRASPRQADGMIVAGWCTTKMAPRVVRLYEQIPDPKWVVAMGSCAISGNIWDTYSIVQGIDALIPVDVYVPGCPPRPEALWQGLEMIRDRVKQSRHAYDGLRRIPARATSADNEACA
jgi:NADH-quinone oxidoreductase subunit B